MAYYDRSTGHPIGPAIFWGVSKATVNEENVSVFSSLTDRQKMMGLAALGGLCAAPLLGYAVAVSPKILVAGILLSACGHYCSQSRCGLYTGS